MVSLVDPFSIVIQSSLAGPTISPPPTQLPGDEDELWSVDPGTDIVAVEGEADEEYLGIFGQQSRSVSIHESVVGLGLAFSMYVRTSTILSAVAAAVNYYLPRYCRNE